MVGIWKKQEPSFSKNTVSFTRFIAILPFAFISWYYRINVVTCLPQLYLFIFSIVKEHLEREALPAEIPIYVYEFADVSFYKIITVILLFGALRCAYLIFRAPSFFDACKRIVYHGTVLNLKISIVTSIVYLVPLTLIGKLYVDKLWLLAEKKEYITVGYNPFKLMLHVAQKINLLDYTIKSLQRLQQAKVLYAHINDMSELFYLTALGIALLSTMWFVVRLQKKIRA
jgi:hypothetical protein